MTFSLSLMTETVLLELDLHPHGYLWIFSYYSTTDDHQLRTSIHLQILIV